MEVTSKRNIVLTVIVAILILVIGVSFAYFLAQTLINGEGSTSKVTTAVIKDTTFTVTGELEFNDEGIYPGHKNVSKIKVVAKENAGVTIDYNLIWNGRNSLATPINYYVYKTTSNENPSITCEVQKGMKSGYEIIYEECTNNNFDNIGEIISSGTITTSDETRKIVLKENESIISSDEGTTVYYYVVLEYPNLDVAQNRDSEHTFQGEVTVELYEKTTCGTHNVTTVLGVLEVNDCEPDFSKTSEEADTGGKACSFNGNLAQSDVGITEEGCSHVLNIDGEYYTTDDFENVGSGTWNSETLTCTKNEKEVLLTGDGSVTQEQCEKDIYQDVLYNDYYAGIEEVGAGTWEEEEIIGKTGIYEVEDGMYGGTSYYYRGAVENNYLKFADYCWRIVRINGDSSIRLIYDGETCHANAVNTTDSLIFNNIDYNFGNRSEYVGYTYVEGKQRPEAEDYDIQTNSHIKEITDAWYNHYIFGQELDSKVAISKYCNDREVADDYTWSSQPSNRFNYAALGRIDRIGRHFRPTLHCKNKNDIYDLKIGNITADEAIMAGSGLDVQANTSHYLYNGQGYWTMTPHSWSGGDVGMFIATFIGSIFADNAGNLKYGIRPVLSLNPNNISITGTGTISDPYDVLGTNDGILPEYIYIGPAQ